MIQRQEVGPSADQLDHALRFEGFQLDDYREVATRLSRRDGVEADHEQVLFDMLVAQVHVFAFDPAAVDGLQEALLDEGASLVRTVARLRDFAAHFALDLEAAIRVARDL